MWWMNDSWGKACCASCGANIQASGGDPDWGYCWNCFNNRLSEREHEREMERQYNEAMDAQYQAQMALEFGRIECESWQQTEATSSTAEAR